MRMNDMERDSLKKKVRRLARAIKTEKFFDVMYHFIDAVIHKKKVVRLTADSVEQYCKDNHETVMEVESRRNRLVYEPPFFEESEGKEYQFLSPSIYIAILHDVTVLSETGMVWAKKNILCDMVKRDKEHRAKWPWGAVRRVDDDKVLLVISRKVIEVEQAINLCGFASNNYYHFTMEVLSRLKYVDNLPEAEECPILIDERIKAYQQLEELLQVVCPERKIIYVPYDVCVKVHRLIQPSMNTWGLLNMESWDLSKISDSMIAQSGIMNIRSCADSYMTEQTQRKIYISRKNYATTRLVNESAIIPLFQVAGFEIVYPETLSYIEQVEVFSSAKCVVGVTGAALTNVLYCHPGTVIGCIIPREYGFCIYSTMAELIGCRTMFLSPDIVERNECIVAEKYQVDEEQCKRYICELDRLCLQDE